MLNEPTINELRGILEASAKLPLNDALLALVYAYSAIVLPHDVTRIREGGGPLIAKSYKAIEDVAVLDAFELLGLRAMVRAQAEAGLPTAEGSPSLETLVQERLDYFSNLIRQAIEQASLAA